MGTIKRCGLFGLSSILLSTGLSVLLYAPSYASSAYDNAYQTTNTLNVTNSTLGCADDISGHWRRYITEEDRWYSSFNQIELGQVKASFESALANGRWGVTQQNNGTDDERVSVFWSEDTSLSLYWYTDGVLAQGVNYVTISCAGDGVDNPIRPYVMSWSDMQNKHQAGVFISYIGANYYNHFVYTDYPNLPADYEGSAIVSGVLPTPDLTDQLSFTAEVNDKIITLWNTTPSPPLTGDDRCKFTLYDSTGTGDVLWDTEYASFCSQVHTIDIQKILNGSYGTYTIMLSVQRDTNSDGMPDIDVGYFQKPVVVDGSTYSMTAGHTFVDKSTDYEDCTTFGWDVAQRLTCEIGNATKKVTDFITGLFIPNRLLIQQKQDEFMSDLRSHIPAFVQTYTWLTVDLIQAFAAGDEVVCNHSFGYFFGSEFVFNQCALEQKFPQIWAVVALVIRATVAFALIMLIYKKMKIIIYGERFHDKGAF